jgi:hypothetical protein
MVREKGVVAVGGVSVAEGGVSSNENFWVR